jgi:hypothetical protein
MRSGALAALGAALLLVTLGGCAGSPRSLSTEVEGASGAPLDKKYLAFLDEERRKPNGRGLVLIGASLGRCGAGRLSLGQAADGQYKHLTNILGYGERLFRSPRIEPYALPAGDYLVGDVAICESILGGPHAKFSVRPGEFVDLGTLTFDRDMFASNIFATRRRIRRSIEPADPGHVAKLREDAPALSARLLRRHMVLAGPEEAELSVRPQTVTIPVVVR